MSGRSKDAHFQTLEWAFSIGYNLFYFEAILPNMSNTQIPDVWGYTSNYTMIPIPAIGICALVGWIFEPKTVIDEVTLSGCRFRREKLYVVMIKLLAPASSAPGRHYILNNTGILEISHMIGREGRCRMILFYIVPFTVRGEQPVKK